MAHLSTCHSLRFAQPAQVTGATGAARSTWHGTSVGSLRLVALLRTQWIQNIFKIVSWCIMLIQFMLIGFRSIFCLDYPYWCRGTLDDLVFDSRWIHGRARNPWWFHESISQLTHGKPMDFSLEHQFFTASTTGCFFQCFWSAHAPAWRPSNIG